MIGNPPWDRIKLQEVEWFAPRDSEIALLTTAAARKSRIKWLRDNGDPMADDFDAAKRRHGHAGSLRSGARPVTTRSWAAVDINLYSLFVERATRLVKPDWHRGPPHALGNLCRHDRGQVLQGVSTGGRVAGLFDFENRKIFFKDVHASFKFCAFVFGGEERRFPETPCAFFLHDTATVNDPERVLPPGAVGLLPSQSEHWHRSGLPHPPGRRHYPPHLRTAPRPCRPLGVDEQCKVWPVQLPHGLFNMTNDSQLFRTAPDLQAEGYYPVRGNRWKKGDELYLPLYQGRMIHQFDHRANSVVANPRERPQSLPER